MVRTSAMWLAVGILAGCTPIVVENPDANTGTVDDAKAETSDAQGASCNVDADCTTPHSCQTGSCDTAAGVCVYEQVEGTCFVDDDCYLPGQSKPGDNCKVCDPAQAPETLLNVVCSDGGTCDPVTGSCTALPDIMGDTPGDTESPEDAEPGDIPVIDVAEVTPDAEVTDTCTSCECLHPGEMLCTNPGSAQCSGSAIANCVDQGDGCAVIVSQECGSSNSCLVPTCEMGATAFCSETLVNCGAYQCDDLDGCLTSCATTADCAGATSCVEGECVEGVVNGGECGANNECLSDYCDNGICCDGGNCCVDSSKCPASASLNVEQTSNSGSSWGVGNGELAAQSFTPTIDGHLKRIDLWMSFSTQGVVVVEVRAGGPEGEVLASADAFLDIFDPGDWLSFDFESTGVVIEPGEVFTIVVSMPEGGYGFLFAAGGDVYGGEFLTKFGDSAWQAKEQDSVFTVWHAGEPICLATYMCQ